MIANNPSKYTYLGTGTYIVGHGDVAVIDPGPILDEHREALAAALAGDRVRAILVTHCHSDHSPLAAWLRDETGAPTIAFGPHGAVEIDAETIDDEIEDGVTLEETTDIDFDPDVRVGRWRSRRHGRRMDDARGATRRGTPPTTCATRSTRSSRCSRAIT